MIDAVDHTPSAELLKKVRAALIMRDLSFSKYCSDRGLTRQNAAAALVGKWTGPKAGILVDEILCDLEMKS